MLLVNSAANRFALFILTAIAIVGIGIGETSAQQPRADLSDEENMNEGYYDSPPVSPAPVFPDLYQQPQYEGGDIEPGNNAEAMKLPPIPDAEPIMLPQPRGLSPEQEAILDNFPKPPDTETGGKIGGWVTPVWRDPKTGEWIEGEPRPD